MHLSDPKERVRWLKEQRLNCGFSAKGFARELKIAEGSVRYMEQGLRPHPRTAKKVADFYGVLPVEIWPVEDVA